MRSNQGSCSARLLRRLHLGILAVGASHVGLAVTTGCRPATRRGHKQSMPTSSVREVVRESASTAWAFLLFLE
jgi:hypothetical protein